MGNFVRQLAVLEYIPCSKNSLCVFWAVTFLEVGFPRDMNHSFRVSSVDIRWRHTCPAAPQLAQCFVELLLLLLTAGPLYRDANILTVYSCYATGNRVDFINKRGLAALLRVDSLLGSRGISIDPGSNYVNEIGRHTMRICVFSLEVRISRAKDAAFITPLRNRGNYAPSRHKEPS